MAITLTTNWQKVAEASNKVTSNATGYIRLYMKYGNTNVSGNKDTIYYEIRQAASNPYGTYLAWEWTGSYDWSIRSAANTISPNPITGKMVQSPAVYSDGVELVRVSGSYEQEHNYDGTFSDTITLSGPIYKTIKTATGDIVLPTIVRNPSLSVSCSNTYGVNGTTISATVGDTGGLSTKVQYSFNNSSWSDWVTIQGNNTTTSQFSVPISSLPNSSTINSITIYFRATNNNGTSGTKSLTINIDSGIKPSMNSNYPYLTPINTDAPSAFSGLFVKSLSKVQVTLKGTPYANGGASLKQFNVNALEGFSTTVAKSGISVSDNTGTWTYDTKLEKSGSISVKAVAVDTRNRTSSEVRSQYYTVYDYAAPTISNMTVQRCTSDGTVSSTGTYCKLYFDYAFSSVNGKNTKTIHYKVDSGSWTQITVSKDSGSISIIISGTYATSVTATIYVRLRDEVYTGDTIVYSRVLGAGYVLRSLHAGNDGITLGRVATEAGFNVYLESKFMEKLKIGASGSYGIWNEAGNKQLLADYGNNNVVLSAAGGTLFVGYQNTTGLNFLNGKGSMDSSGNLTVSGKLNAKSIKGSYTGRGGKQNPNYFGTESVGFLMMNTSVNGDSHYKDWLIMDCYSGTDVGGATAFGIDRQEMRAFIMGSDADRNSWNRSAELAKKGDILTNTNQLTNGAGFINTSASSKAQSGYFKLSNGLIVQWGTCSTGSAVTMPTSFSSTTSFAIVGTDSAQGASATVNIVVSAANKFTAYAKYGSTYYTDTVRWIAIGY